MPTKKTVSTTTSMPKNKAEFAQDMTKLSDKELITDTLNTQKSLVKLYSTALTEASCEKLRNLLNKNFSECACDQYDAFLFMNEHNMYPTEPAPAQKVTQAKQKFAAIEKQIKK